MAWRGVLKLYREREKLSNLTKGRMELNQFKRFQDA
jgi:hypothetical protein